MMLLFAILILEWLELSHAVVTSKLSVTMSALSGDIGAMYATVRTNVVNGAYRVTSLHPAGYLSKISRSPVKKEVNQIKEIIYVPSLLSSAGADFLCCTEDDEHWCSQLCERGYVVHMLTNLAPRSDYEDAIESVLSWRTKTIPARSICLCASELTCPILLRYLSIALMMGPHRKDVGAVALLQPPPLQKLSSFEGRNSVLSRYKHLGEEQVRECVGDYGQVVYDLLHNKAPPAKPSTEEEEQDATEKERKRLEEARLRAEIETLEWQSSEDYKGKEAKRMRNLKKKKEKLQKMVYDNQGCVSSGDLLAAKLKQLAQNPLTVADICQEGPALRRASLVGEALKDRILVICTDNHQPRSQQGQGASPLFPEEREREGRVGADDDSVESIFELMDAYSEPEDTWGRQACAEVAALYQNEPVVHLPDIEDEEEEEEGAKGRVLLVAEKEEEDEEEEDVWDAEMTRKHRLLAEVLDQWLVGLTTFGYI